MLELLHIENIAVIERADITLAGGLTVLTGETGAGKSILIDAIGALLGQRTSRDLVRAGAPFGLVSAVFTDFSPELLALLEEYDLKGDDPTELLVQRRISAEGKNVCRVNMKPASTAVLRALAPYLINVHGQHDGAKLMDASCHMDYLDRFADVQALLATYQPMYHQLRKLKRQITDLTQNEQQRQARVAQLTEQLDEIQAAALQIGEQEQLTDRKIQFDHAERLALAFDRAILALDDPETGGACTALGTATTALQSLADLSPALAQLGERATEVKILAEELRLSVANAQARVEFSPTEHAAIEERLDVIYRICQKYNSDPRGVLDYAQTAQAELLQLTDGDDTKTQLHEQYRTLLAQAREAAAALSMARQTAAAQLQDRIVHELAALDMQRVRFAVEVQVGNKLALTGVDAVQFLIAVNPGEPLKPLAKVASGGELSRVMLAMKNVLTAQEPVGTLIFDEIDTGVSGRAAQRIAHKLSQIGAQKQTICVTHLPQIAAFGDHHLLIAKDTTGVRTFTSVTPLTGDDRAHELARMLAGDEISDAALANARALVQR